MYKRILLYSLLFAISALCQSVSGQVSDYQVIWLNADQEKLAGDLKIELQPDLQRSQFALLFRMEWHDSRGSIISDAKSKPLIYLSSSDIRILQKSEAFCKTFTNSDVFDIYFSDEGKLVFGFLPDLNQELEIQFDLKYAYTQEDIFNAKTYNFKYPEGDKLIFRIPISLLKTNDIEEPKDLGITTDPMLAKLCNEVDSCILEIRKSTKYLLDEITNSGFQGQITKLEGEISSPDGLDSTRVFTYEAELNRALKESYEFLSKLDDLSDQAIVVENRFKNPIPADSINRYQVDLELITRRVDAAKNDILNYRGQMRSLLNSIGIQVIPNDLTEQREQITSMFFPIFTSQFEYISRLLRQHEALMLELRPILSDLPSKAIRSSELDSLVRFHGYLRDSIEASRITHRNDYIDYSAKTKDTGPISNLESIHGRYDDSYDILKQEAGAVESEIINFRRRVEEIETKQDYTLLWIGGGIFIFLIFFFLIREIRRGRKREEVVISNGVKADFDMDEEITSSGGYYPFIVPTQIESVVKEVHFSFRAIMSINQIVQGAISNKTALSFGGYFFGSQYKAQGQGAGMYIVMIDQVIESKTLRKDFVPGVSTNEDIVDEIDRIIGENKKKTILGWFTSTDGDEYEMPESLIKVHRTFFRDRWQTALLINPFTSDLNSAIYLRRKSGYFDPKASTNSLLKIEELYQYSQNPPIQSEDIEEFSPDLNDFVRIDVSGRWCDSIVKSVFFRKDVIGSMSKELHVERMKLTNKDASGYLYGQVITDNKESNGKEYSIYINRYVDASSGETPRDLPGFNLLGWIGLNNKEILESLKTAIPYHSIHFKKSYQVAVIVNTSTMEMRIFSQKHSLELNNNTIETEEFSFNNLLKS